jgi:tetratricopeptide (TPR) repeat protein
VRSLSRGRGGHRFETLGLLELKGLPEPVAACAVVWEPRRGVDLPPLPPELAAASRLTFVGREDELRRAVAMAMGTEEAHALWILGEPGIGKTRLATELARRAHTAGALVLFGRCDQDVAAPYQPIIEALRWYIAQLDDERLARSLGQDPPPLRRLVPELQTRLPGLAGQDVTTELEQYRLFEAVRSWLASVSADQPVVLVVDDVHWANHATLALLAHIVRPAGPCRLLIVGTARDTDPDASPRLAELVDELDRSGRSAETRLAALRPEDVAVLVGGLTLAADERDDLVARLAAETGGNPLFLGAVLAGLGAASPDAADAALPPDLGSAVRRRVRGLDDPVRDLLLTAAVIGLDFSIALLAEAAGIGDADALTRVERAVASGLVQEVDVDRFRFTHALVRDHLAAEPGPSRRAHLHAAIAAAIERRHGADLDEHLRALAHHHAAAGSPDAAFGYARRSAQHALQLLAFDAATADLGFALEQLDRLPAEPATTRVEVLMAQGEAQRLSGQHTTALDTLGGAARLARAGADDPAFVRAALAFEDASWRAGHAGLPAVVLLEEASRRVSPSDERTAVWIEASLARAQHYRGHHREAREIAERALARAEASGDDALLGHALLASVQTRVPMRTEELALVMSRSQRCWDLGAVDPTALTIAQYAAVAAHVAGDRDLASLWVKREYHVAEVVGSRFFRYVADAIQEVEAFLDGDLGAAEQRAEEMQRLGEELGEDLSGLHGLQLFVIRREQGRLQELAPLVRILASGERVAHLWGPGAVLLLAEIGAEDEARSLLSSLEPDRFAAVPYDSMFPASIAFLAEAAAMLADGEAAATLGELIAPWRHGAMLAGQITAHLGSGARYLGLTFAARGLLDEARDCLEEALAFNRRARSVMWVAHTLADLGEIHRRAGRSEASATCAEEARELASRHGLTRVHQRLALLIG